MADDAEEKDDIPEPKEDIYHKLTTKEPELPVDVPDDETHKPLDQAEAESPNQTDLQATLKRLFPHFKHKYIDSVAQAAMVARIAPDIFLDMHYLTVTSVVEEMECDGEEIDVQSVINLVYAALSIGLDGKGRIDALELAGSQRETEELEKLSKGLGF